MNSQQAVHLARVHQLRESFAEANERLVARLRRAEDAAAQHVPSPTHWSAAQIGWHVAHVTTRFAELVSGEGPGAQPLPADFHERSWTAIAAEIPQKLQAPNAFHPPPHVRRAAAIAALEQSGVRMARAFDRLTPERGAGFGISSPIVGGVITVYQVAEWATAHVIRHNKQAKRLLEK